MRVSNIISVSFKTKRRAKAGNEGKRMNVRESIEEFFKENKIEYFSFLRYGDCREINSAIIGRENFSPRSVIMFVLPYYTGECENMSIYASSLDYHIAIREVTEGVIEILKRHYQDCSAKGYGDHSPIDERHAALISGLGILGDSGLLINEKYGTYIFIGDVVTDIAPEELGYTKPCEIEKCEGCGICKAKCPTGILRGECDDCLSAITQRKGDLTDDEIKLMRQVNTVWGCDECQRYCPHNKKLVLTPIPFFYRDRIASLNSEILQNMSRSEFQKRAFAWRGRRTVERNLKHLDL